MENKIIHKAEFNELVKTYILLYVFFILLITVIGIPLAIIWICGVGQWYSKHYFAKLDCVLTEHHLSFRKGILFQFEKTIPLENIQDLSFIEGPFLKRFNLAILRVETAGSGHKYANQMSLVGIIGAQEFRTKVLEQKRNLAVTNSNSQTTEELLNEIKQILLRIEKKDTL